MLPSESAITTNQSFSCFPAHSAQHCTLWEHRKRVRPAGLPIPGPGSLLLHQRVLAEASPDTMTVESIYESFLTLLMAGITSGTVCWKAVMGENNQRYFVWGTFFFSLSLSLLFGEILCHVNTMMFFLIIIISFFSHWLTLWISAQPLARRPPLHLHSYQKAPKLPKWVTLSCLFLWEAKAQNWHFHQFLYMAKKTQLCQVSQYTHNYHTNVVMNVLWVVEQRKDI